MSGFFARTVALTRAILLRKPLSKICPNSSTGIISIWSTPGSVCTVTARNIHLSSQSRGLDEFFPLTDDIIEEGERSGRAWSANELRMKSNDDLHKLWYVLLKERNMLLTLDNEANRCRFNIPAPERTRKVKKGMARIKYVLHERSMAIQKAKIDLGLIPPPVDEDSKEEASPESRVTYYSRDRSKHSTATKRKLKSDSVSRRKQSRHL